MSFQPSPWVSSTSVGVEDKDRDKSKPNGEEISMMLRTPMAEKVQDRALMGPNNSEEHKSHYSCSRTGEDSCLLPYSDDQSTGHRRRKNKFL